MLPKLIVPIAIDCAYTYSRGAGEAHAEDVLLVLTRADERLEQRLADHVGPYACAYDAAADLVLIDAAS
jgi:hypothetical protein